jgi:hypothetical protein
VNWLAEANVSEKRDVSLFRANPSPLQIIIRNPIKRQGSLFSPAEIWNIQLEKYCEPTAVR